MPRGEAHEREMAERLRKPTFAEAAAASLTRIEAASSRATSAPPSSAGTSNSSGALRRAEDALAEEQGRNAADGVEQSEGAGRRERELVIKCSELKARTAARKAREAAREAKRQATEAKG